MLLNDVKNKLTDFGISNKKQIVLSISGGVDSIVLLDVLSKLNYINIHLIHFNYSLHENANKASSFIEKLALENNYFYKIYYPNIPEKNFECLSRNNRYELLLKYSNNFNCDCILTAHHFDDQLETLIMNDNKNADWISFLGVREKYGNIFRPLLDMKKNKIYNYACKNKLVWFEDDTNNSLLFLRNNVRKKLAKKEYSKDYISSLLDKHNESKIKMLKYKLDEDKYSPILYSFSNNVLFLSKNVKDYFEGAYLKLFVKKIISLKFNLIINKSNNFWFLLYDFIDKCNLGSSFYFSEKIILKCERENFIIYNKEKLEAFYKIEISGKTQWNETFFSVKNLYSSAKCIDVLKCPNDIIKKGLYVTNWIHGDTIKTNKGFTKKVSDIFINNKMSYYDKKNYPIIRDSNNHIIWIPNLEFEKFNTNNTTNIYWMRYE